MNAFVNLKEEELQKTNGGDIALVLGIVSVVVGGYQVLTYQVERKAREDALRDMGYLE